MTAKTQQVTISAPNFELVQLTLIGETPYMQARFSAKAKQAMMSKMEAGSVAKKGAKRDGRNFDDDYRQAMYISTEGWNGINASCFRNACISACRIVGFKMTLAKLSIFIEHDGIDVLEGQPLVKINGTPERIDMMTRNATGVADVRVRPLWREWSCDLRIRYDADQFTTQDIINLISRVGMQVGIGEGRPDSKSSAGLGYGLFRVEAKK